MEERKFNVQQQNKNLEKELSEVSALTKFNHKLHESKCQSRCVAPPWNFKDAQNSTKICCILTTNAHAKYLRKVQVLRN